MENLEIFHLPISTLLISNDYIIKRIGLPMLTKVKVGQTILTDSNIYDALGIKLPPGQVKDSNHNPVNIKFEVGPCGYVKVVGTEVYPVIIQDSAFDLIAHSNKENTILDKHLIGTICLNKTQIHNILRTYGYLKIDIFGNQAFQYFEQQTVMAIQILNVLGSGDLEIVAFRPDGKQVVTLEFTSGRYSLKLS